MPDRLGQTESVATYRVNKRGAAEWEHTEVMVAAHRLLLYLDKSRV
jgi:hypothetical protein